MPAIERLGLEKDKLEGLGIVVIDNGARVVHRREEVC